MLEVESTNALFFSVRTLLVIIFSESFGVPVFHHHFRSVFLYLIVTFPVISQFLEKIWVEIGESEAEKDRMLMELERECLQIYQRKVDEAANSKAQLHQIVV
ncbi:hypothetical protein YC2023_024961 [Brassica napus]